MARALIVGCGCRGRELGRELLGAGWAARGTSRDEAGVAQIEAAGLEAARADPARPGEILELVADVTVVAWLLGSARGAAAEVEPLFSDSLERLLERLVETPVRKFVFEAGGSAPEELRRRGEDVVRAAGARWRIPVAMPNAVRLDQIAKL